MRPRALGEFNEAIVIANRALRDGEMFEVTIDKMVDRWTGAIEAGVYLKIKLIFFFFLLIRILENIL